MSQRRPQRRRPSRPRCVRSDQAAGVATVRTDQADQADLVGRQCWVLTTGQAERLFGAGVVRAQLTARRWQRPHRGVVVLHNGPLTPAQTRWADLLRCAPGAVLGGLSALHAEGMDGFEPAGTWVVLPEGSRRPPGDRIRPHWSTRLGHDAVHPLRFPPRTRVPRSTLDAASWTDSPRRSRVLVLAAVQQRVVRHQALYGCLPSRGNCRHHALILESIHDASGGIQSLPEHDFELVRRRYLLPEPTRQSVMRRQGGRCYLDVEWRRYGAACEVHGIPHLWVPQWDADLERANEVTLAGPRLLVFSSYAVRRRQPVVGDQLVRLLRRGGWAGR